MINLDNGARKNWKRFLKLFFTALFVFFIFTWFDFHSIYDAIRHVSWYFYIFVIAGHFVLMAIKALRWQFLLQSMHVPCSYSQAVKAYTAGFAFGTFTPGQLGDMGKVMLIPGATGHRREALISTLTDRIWDFLGLVLVSGACALFLFFSEMRVNGYFFYGVVFGCIGLLFSTFVYRYVQKFIRRKLNLDIAELLKAWHWSFLLTVLALAVQFSRWVILALAFKLPVITAAAIAMVGTLVALLPVSFGGMGTREATIAALFTHNGLDPVVGVSFSLLMLGSYLVGALAGALLLFFLYKDQTQGREG